MADARKLFVAALQRLMQEHGVRAIMATFDATVLITFKNKKTQFEFCILEPKTKVDFSGIAK